MWGRVPDSQKNSLILGTSLAVQRLRPWASSAGNTGSILGQGTKIPQAVWLSNPHPPKKIHLFLQESSFIIVALSLFFFLKMWSVISIPSKIAPVEEAGHWNSRVLFCFLKEGHPARADIFAGFLFMCYAIEPHYPSCLLSRPDISWPYERRKEERSRGGKKESFA